MIDAPIPLILESMDATTLRRLLSRVQGAIGDRVWSECDGLTYRNVSIHLDGFQFNLKTPGATFCFERIDPVVRDFPGPAGILRSWLKSTHHSVAESSDGCDELRCKLNEAARLMTLACALSGRNNAIGWADNVRDYAEGPPCRFGWYEGDDTFAAPSELIPWLERVSPAYRSYGPSLSEGEWTIKRDRMAAYVRELDPMWMLRRTSEIPAAGIERLGTGVFKGFRRLF